MRIDLNADLGESFGSWTMGDDTALMPLLTSANVACGFHAGDPLTMRRSCETAVELGVVIGAHVGYRDLAGFGRRFIDMDADELAADVTYQLAALHGVARAAGGVVRYMKPHGALYHAVNRSAGQADAVLAAVGSFDATLVVLGMPRSDFLARAARAGLATATEYFVDRAYTPEGDLVDRRAPGAVLHDPGEAAARAVEAARAGVADSFCVHGDTPEAVAMASRVRTALLDAGAELAPFAR